MKISGTNYLCFKIPYAGPRLEGNWQILGMSNNLHEKDMEKVCEVWMRPFGIKNYVDYEFSNKDKHRFINISESFQSLLTANNITKPVLVLVKK